MNFANQSGRRKAAGGKLRCALLVLAFALFACRFSESALAQTALPLCLPLYFEAGANPGEFLARGRDVQFLVLPGEARLTLYHRAAAGGSANRTLRMQFIGADRQARIAGQAELPGKINYLIGNDPTRWRTGVAACAGVVVQSLYPGINLTYHGNDRRLEYDFTIAPGANPQVIAMRFDGADHISTNADGDLVLTLGDREIRQPRPVIFQTVGGGRKEISGGYRMVDTHTVAFAIGNYDPRLPLVIDPILGYSTYFGGNGDDTAWAVAVDTNGFVYIAGQTTSTQLAPGQPLATSNAVQTTEHGGSQTGDAFVAKFSGGTNLVYMTYLGGSADDAAYGLAVDATGDAYVAGATESPDFPLRNALYSGIHGGTVPNVGYFADAFVTELGPAGSNLVYSTYLGGNNTDAAYALAVDAAGNAYVTGLTYSTNFPVTTNAFQKQIGVRNWAYQAYYNANAFVTEIGAGGSNLVYSSYFGGTNFDAGEGIAVDAGGSIYVSGWTASTNFPTTNAVDQMLNSNLINGAVLNNTSNQTFASDAFVAKFAPAGTGLVYSTLLGGSSADAANRLAVDAAGNAYVTGWTFSADFPNTVTHNPILHNGVTNNLVGGLVTNAFLTQITWNGTNAGIGFSSVFGGTNNGVDIGYGVAVDAAGNVFVAGTSSSTSFPVTVATNALGLLRATNSGGSDVFVIAFAPGGSNLLYSAEFGGAGNDPGYAIALDSADNAFVAGNTASANFPVRNALQTTLNGAGNAFLSEIILNPPLPEITAQPTNQSAGVGGTVNFAVVAAGTPPLIYQWQRQETNLLWANMVNGGIVSGATNATLTLTNLAVTNSGSYRVIVANDAGSVTSAVVVLTVTNIATEITGQPVSQTVAVGATVTFSVSGSAQSPFSLQWFKDGAALADGTNAWGSILVGATNSATLTIYHAQTNDDGAYQLVISNAWGVLASSNAFLTVVAFPTILTPPTNQTVGLGADVTNVVSAVGSGTLSYQWQFNGTNLTDDGTRILGSATDTLILKHVQTEAAGYYTVVVTNSLGAVTSAPPAELTVLTAPVFTGITFLGTNGGFILSGVGGTNSGTFFVLAATNLATPLTQWTPLNAYQFSSQGRFAFTNFPPADTPQRFYRLQLTTP
ncbi:MAG TPA: SBBP repeat-containing protein [Verrucomicrobiae bacterium]|nr:SBBP repeat-containing protein [Verrucomicrobiae bacterium]